MQDHPALETLRRAVNCYRLGQPREALALAEAAYKMTDEIPGAPVHTGVVGSWYGFLLGTIGRRPADGLAICRAAAANNFWEPRAYELLAKLELAIGNRRQALETAERGLAVAPEDQELSAFRQSLGVRKAPPFPFLGRQHPLNRWIGRLRTKNVGVRPLA